MASKATAMGPSNTRPQVNMFESIGRATLEVMTATGQFSLVGFLSRPNRSLRLCV